MSSIIEGYNYDIFISYRQKDNKGDHWVTEFVEALKTELDSTFKEDISIYYDENPHDGLLETHDVDASLKEKMRCLVFIPIISRTYCDPKAFAWEHEFIAFIKQASGDRLGLKVSLPNGNIATRILPVRIHELGSEDTELCESALGGMLRGVDFIYKSPGVNRPLRRAEEHPKDNQNRTYYRDQINKVANAIDEILQGLRSGKSVAGKYQNKKKVEAIGKGQFLSSIRSMLSGMNDSRKFLITLFVIICCVAAVFIYSRAYLKKTENTFTFIRLTNLNNDSSLVNDAANFTESINEKIYLIKAITLRPVFRDQFKDITEPLHDIRKKVKSNYILDGNIRRDGNQIKIYIELTSSRKNKVVLTKPIIYERNASSKIAIDAVKDIAESMEVTILPDEEKLIMNELSSNPDINFNYISANKNLKDAWYYYNYGDKLHDSASFMTSIESYDKIIKDDTTSALPYAKRAIARSFGFYLEQLDSSNIEKCRQDIDKALTIDRDLSEIDIAQGFYYYYCLEENEKAFDFFRRASVKDPQSYRPLFYMALAARRMGRWEDCLKLIRQVIKFNPQEALFLTNIGMTYAFFHDFDSAIIFQDRSIDLIPGWAAGYKNKFESMILKNGITAEARELVDDAIEKTGDKMTEYKLLIKIYDKKYSEAFTIAENADPVDFEIPADKYLYLAMLSNILNNPAGRKKYYELAKSFLLSESERKPKECIPHGMLGLAYAGLGDKIKAYEEVKKAIQIAYVKNRMDESDMKVYLAQAYTMLGDYDDAFPGIQYLLNNPSFFSKKLLQSDPVWKPLLDSREYRKKIR